MMQLWIKVILIAFCSYNLIRLIVKRKEVIGPGEFVFWGGLWAGAIVVVAFPSILKSVTLALQIGRQVDLVIYITIPLLFYINYKLAKKFDSIDNKFTDMVRGLAIQEAEKKYGRRK